MPENQNIEYKSNWRDEYLKWICGFANAKGAYLEIIIEDYPYPVNYKGQYHYRSGSTKQELKGAALDKFMLQKKGKKWDGVPVPKVSVSDLKQDTFEFFRKRAFKSCIVRKRKRKDYEQRISENK